MSNKLQGTKISHFYSDDKQKEAIVKSDGYGLLYIEYIYQGNIMETEWFPKYTLNTVEDIAENYVSE